MNISKFLSKIIGLYEIIISSALLMNLDQFRSNIQGMMNNEPLMIYIGCVTVIMGLLLVVSHNIWQWQWRVMVTIVSWIVLIKGTSILLFPQALDQITIQFLTNNHFAYTILIVDFFFGFVFCYFGFRREK